MNNLYKHQIDIIAENRPKTGLWLGTGAGKTLIALLLARGKTLVICPKTQKEDKNWERECQKNNLKIDLTVISKETFRRDAHSLPVYETVIVDECHTSLGVTPNIRWKNKKPIPKTSQIFEALKQYLERTKPERLYLCTATIIRSPMTVWGAGKLLGRDWNWYKWRDTFYTKIPIPQHEVWIPKTDNSTKNRLAGIVLTIGYTGQLSDYFDVPDQTYKTEFVELIAKQKKRIKELPLEYPDPIVLVGKKHQVENGVLLGNEFIKTEIFDNAKIDRLVDYALEFPRMIVFAKYIAQIEQIALAMRNIGKKVFILTGEVKERGNVIFEANSCDNYVFIAQSQISSGWELPDCPVMIFASMSYSVVDRIQSEGRILRANKLKKNLYITLVVKGGVDEHVKKCIDNKQDFHERMYI